MATLVLSAAGAALGSKFTGTVLGLTGAVVGRALGATVGRVIDQRILGSGSDAVETGRIDRLRLIGASEGAPVPRIWGRMRVGGQVIWATQFLETVTSTGGGGKALARKPKVDEFSYSISLAIALCEGPIAGIGRIWADGEEIARADLSIRLHDGSDDQLPDPRIEAVEGVGHAPAYRGIAYVVIEDLELEPFGNRVPQFSFEVLRAAAADGIATLQDQVRAVALMPGTGDYALATTQVTYDLGLGEVVPANVNSPSGVTDMDTALDALQGELPEAGSALLIVSWFGDDLRAGQCRVEPKVENAEPDGDELAWSVAGRARAATPEIAQLGERPVYGSTPSDASVIEAVQALSARGIKGVFYPFLLMDQMDGNGLPDPWSDAADQPVLPWRGRITTEKAPGQPGSPDGTAAAEAEVAAFFGTAQPGDFAVHDGQVSYSGPDEWSYRRFILHYAALCTAAGGVDAFCIGSEMRALTQIRGAGNSFPAVAALRALAADVRAIMGPEVKLTYAADWSEYFGYIDGDGNRWFHLDPLWADEQIDFIGIDNYMPLSDWREGDDHLDAQAWRSIHDLDYLKSNVMGGEGYAWYYQTPQHRDAQLRTPITDGAYDEPWIWRYKDLLNWWSKPHHERIAGVRAEEPTDWEPRSKPIWFTELGCAAIDKGTNQPNKFLDPKSSESAIPHYSTGQRDDLIQMQYLRAMHEFWDDPAVNPVSDIYGGRMVDMSRAHVWAWDTRPFPWFPGNTDLWADGENWARGHWLTGRALNQPLAAVVAEICAGAGVLDADVRALDGLVRGYAAASTDTGRALLQPLMLAFGIEALERDGRLIFRHRDGRAGALLDPGALVADDDGAVETLRAARAEVSGRVRVSYVEAGADFQTRTADAVFPDESAAIASTSELPLLLTQAEAHATAARWLAEAQVARDTARFALPPSSVLGAGDVVMLDAGAGTPRRYRLDRVAQGGARAVEAVRVDPGTHTPADSSDAALILRPFATPAPVLPVFMDLPLITGAEIAHAPHLAVTGTPWPGSVAVYDSVAGSSFALAQIISARAAVGETETPLLAAPAGRWDNGAPLRVRMAGAALASATPTQVLAGANLMAVGDGELWELFQFVQASLVAPDTWELSVRLRGQMGTDGVMPQAWAPGATVVLIDTAPVQIDYPLSARGLMRSYRIGPGTRPVDDPSYRDHERSFDGVGLRPYRPVHLRARPQQGGDLRVEWVRRTRVDGDSWAGVEVPLAEESERYLLEVRQGGAVLRSVETLVPEWVYPAAAQAQDSSGGVVELAVAQISASFGPGPFARMELAV